MISECGVTVAWLKKHGGRKEGQVRHNNSKHEALKLLDARIEMYCFIPVVFAD